MTDAVPTKLPELDQDGFLVNLQDWNNHVASLLASNEGIALSPQHWEIIELVRSYHREFDRSPEMRPLVKYVGMKLGADKGKSIYLLKLFPGSPAKTVCKLAGLPKPDNCL